MYAIYFLVKKISGSTVGALASCIFYAFSPALVRMSFDLIKNSMGLFFLALTMLLCYLALKEHSFKYSIMASVFSVNRVNTHT